MPAIPSQKILNVVDGGNGHMRSISSGVPGDDASIDYSHGKSLGIAGNIKHSEVFGYAVTFFSRRGISSLYLINDKLGDPAIKFPAPFRPPDVRNPLPPCHKYITARPGHQVAYDRGFNIHRFHIVEPLSEVDLWSNLTIFSDNRLRKLAHSTPGHRGLNSFLNTFEMSAPCRRFKRRRGLRLREDPEKEEVGDEEEKR